MLEYFPASTLDDLFREIGNEQKMDPYRWHIPAVWMQLETISIADSNQRQCEGHHGLDD